MDLDAWVGLDTWRAIFKSDDVAKKTERELLENRLKSFGVDVPMNLSLQALRAAFIVRRPRPTWPTCQMQS